MSFHSEVRPGLHPEARLDLGATLRALRRRADLSQRELAERSGVPKSTVARIESQPGADPRLRTVERLFHAGGVQRDGSLLALRLGPPRPATAGPTSLDHALSRAGPGRPR
ncbi:helix-turn-helix transcriptional regulator [Salinispora sp. H7-4]|uniref:helix-turn-helix domain-containing protein n=1 Tax=Salinispora sp. H7-4 TaxID=2748321 RepID=UPI002815468D|nr:helix-turn-helix transcriptional regulator [Salinispora sp. H7-4]